MDPGPHERGREVRAGVLGSRLLASAAVWVAAASAPPAARADAPTGRLLVTLAPEHRAGARTAGATAALARAGARIAGPVLPAIGLVTVRPPHGRDPASFARALRARPGVAAVEPEHRYTLRYRPPAAAALNAPETTPGTPLGTPRDWWAMRLGLFSAWDRARGDGATVAVIDTGVDGTHPAFAGRIAAAIDLDDTDGHGPATTDESGHGTHVASLACGAGEVAPIAGTGLRCSLMILKSDLSDASVAAALLEASARRADVISMSFGTDGPHKTARAVRSAARVAEERGSLLVAAAADEPITEQGDPANLLQPTGTGPSLLEGHGLSVTAAAADEGRAPFAGRGTQISLAGYGSFSQTAGPRGILGAFPAATTTLERAGSGYAACGCRTTIDGDPRYAYLQGTSMATPMVAGVAALVAGLNPDLTPLEIAELLKATATRAPGRRWTPELGWGIVDADAAVVAARAADRRAPASGLRLRSRVRDGRATLTLSARDEAPAGCVASGVRAFQVYRALDGGRPRLLRTTRERTIHVAVPRGRAAVFTVRAVDHAGNREPATRTPSVRVRAPAA